jgi:hypothetical protein
MKGLLKSFLSFPIWAKLLTILLLLGLIGQVVEGLQNQFAKLIQPSPVAANSSSAIPSPATNPFSDGVRSATNAAELTQTALSVDHWRQVADEWQAAIDSMKAVQISDVNYETAQQRVAAYQKNLAYAQQNFEHLQQEQAKLQQNQITRGEQVFKNLKGMYQVAGQLTTIPFVRVIIPQEGWNRLSKTDQINLTMYTQSLISVVKSDPGRYVDIPQSAPAYDSFVTKTANLCEDCWSIIVSYNSSQPYGVDETVIEGDTLWVQDEPCCRGIKASEFRGQ